ncbi:hypothetical protein PQX77_004893 [Marasmius sp. AFHP31]|nr:hypothetical protein PQX77_004893 [Marasmius sp. AFHP31]
MLTIVMSATKGLYTIRIWKLQKERHKWVIVFLTLLLVAEYGLGTWFAYETTTFTTFQQVRNMSHRVKSAVLLAMSFSCLTDFLVATALVYTIVQSRPNLGWTSSSFTMLSAYIMNTGAITGFFSLIVLIGFALGVASPLFIVSEMVLPQLYVNCFLSMINASFYFQTKSSLDISIHYRRPSSYLLNLPRMGHGSDPENIPRRKSSSLSSTTVDGYDYSNVTLVKSEGTINEIGLPLFERDDFTRPEVRLGLYDLNKRLYQLVIADSGQDKASGSAGSDIEGRIYCGPENATGYSSPRHVY